MMYDPSTLATAVITLVLPFLISLLVAPDAKPEFKAGLTFALCLITAVLTTIVTDQVAKPDSFTDHWLFTKIIIQNILTCFVLAVSIYKGLSKPLGWAHQLERTGSQWGVQK